MSTLLHAPASIGMSGRGSIPGRCRRRDRRGHRWQDDGLALELPRSATIQIYWEENYGKGESWPRRRHRDKGSKIEKKHGNTRIASLGKEYGASFAKRRRKDMMLKTLLKETGSASLHEYLRHHHK
jgi:hypothetical protein